MKKSVLMLLTSALVLSLMVSGCASKAKSEANNSAIDSPAWLNEMPPEDAIWGIGIAKQSSLSMSQTTAEARGRVSIARQLNSYIQAMFTDYNRDAGTAGSQANVSLQEDVSRQVTNMNLTGATPVRKYIAKDGTYWTVIECKKLSAKAAISNVFDSEAAQYAEFKASQALQMMDNQLAKNDKPLQTNE
jgi:hypothetical protein